MTSDAERRERRRELLVDFIKTIVMGVIAAIAFGVLMWFAYLVVQATY